MTCWMTASGQTGSTRVRNGTSAKLRKAEAHDLTVGLPLRTVCGHSLRDERTTKFGAKAVVSLTAAFEHCCPIQPFVLAQVPVEIETDLDTE
jgi:hypothetical protein